MLGESSNRDTTLHLSRLTSTRRGAADDFKRLRQLRVSLKGKIALAKYGGPFRGLKVKNAQDHGMVACVIFTDPGDDRVTAAKGYAAYPGQNSHPRSVTSF